MPDEIENAESTAPARPAKKPRPCERCGNFGKRTNVLGVRVCADCVDKVVHPALRGPFTFETTLAGVAAVGRSIFLPVLLTSVASRGLTFALLLALYLAFPPSDRTSGLAVITVASALLSFAIVVWIDGFVLRLGWATVTRRDIGWGEAARGGLTGYVALAMTMVRVVLSVLGHTLLLVLPGILRGLDLSAANVVTVVEGKSASDAMDESARLMQPVRSLIFALTTMIGITGGLFWAGTTAIVGERTAGPLVALEAAAIPVRVGFAALSVVLYARQRLPASLEVPVST